MYPRLLQIEGCDQREHFEDEHIEHKYIEHGTISNKVHGLKSLQVIDNLCSPHHSVSSAMSVPEDVPVHMVFLTEHFHPFPDTANNEVCAMQ